MAERRLTPEVLEILGKSKEERIQYAQTDKWVAYPFANGLLAEMEHLLNAPERTRVKSMLVVGVPNSGKTTLKEKFLCRHPAYDSADDSRTIFSILHIEAPSKVDSAAICMKILDALGATYPKRVYFNDLANQVHKILKETKVRMIIVDEFHNFLTGRSDMLEAVLNFIRGLSNQFGIIFLAFGTPKALEVIASEPQLSSRFKRKILPKWDAQGNVMVLKQLLAALEMTLPLKHASHLHKPPLLGKIIAMSEGILGEIVDLLTEATIAAIESGEERITPALLDSLGWLTPKERAEFKYE